MTDYNKQAVAIVVAVLAAVAAVAIVAVMLSPTTTWSPREYGNAVSQDEPSRPRSNVDYSADELDDMRYDYESSQCEWDGGRTICR